ncbi:MAG: hypothetical protein U5L00_12440 [Desulfovermiculus sp.]|nr:hypothetical protein [Desulfovermiculus sp.]
MSSSGLTADLHVHSKYSKRTSQWILQKIDCPECFSDPRRIYGLAQDRENDWFNFVREASDRLIKNFSQTLVESACQARLFNIFATIGSGGSVYALLAPYFLAFGLYSKDRSLAQACLERLQHAPSVTRSKSPEELTPMAFNQTKSSCTRGASKQNAFIPNIQPGSGKNGLD